LGSNPEEIQLVHTKDCKILLTNALDLILQSTHMLFYWLAPGGLHGHGGERKEVVRVKKKWCSQLLTALSDKSFNVTKRLQMSSSFPHIFSMDQQR
jgi:hypothetical protein